MKNHLPTFVFIILCITQTNLDAQQQIVAQLTGAPVDTAGWAFIDAAQLANVIDTGKSEILLCPKNLYSAGAVYYRTPLALGECKKWTIEFDLRMHGGSVADGMALCFLESPFVNLANGGSLGIPVQAKGLRICFDTYNNCFTGQTPKIYIRWKPDGASDGVECLNNQPTISNVNGNLDFLNSAKYTHAKITYEDGRIRVYLKDSLYLFGFHRFDFSGYIGFTAATGGFTNNHSIKNVVIYSEPAPYISIINGPRRGLCGGGTFTYVATSRWDSANYTWSAPPGVSILSGQGTDSVILGIPSNFTSGALSVTANSATCGTGNTRIDTISVKPRIPTEITGSDVVAPQQKGLIYTTSDTEAVTYRWEVPPDATIVSGQGTNSITVDWGDQTGMVKAWVYQCNDSSRQRRKVLVVKPADALELSSGNDLAGINRNAISEKSKLNVYPNPATNIANIIFNANKASKYNILVSDMAGKTIYSKEAVSISGRNNIRLDLNRFAKGVYVITLKSDAGRQTASLYKQ